jgi:hypothetical protein
VERAVHGVAQCGKRDFLGFHGDRARFDLRQVQDVVDQREQVGAGRMDVSGELHLLQVEVALVVLRQLLAEDQDRVQRRAQLVRHVGQELGLVLGGECQLGRLFFQRPPGLFDLVVLPFHFHVLLGELFRLGRELFVRVLQLGLPHLELRGQLLGLLQQILRAHRRFDRIEHDADRLRELFEERQVGGRERMQSRQLDHRSRLAFEQHGEHHDVGGFRAAKAGPHAQLARVAHSRIGLRHVVEQNALLLERALADQSFPERQALGLLRAARI